MYFVDSRQQPDARRALRMSSPKRPSCNRRRTHIPAMVPTAYASRTSGLLIPQSTHIEHSVYFVDRIRGSRKVFVPRNTRIGGSVYFVDRIRGSCQDLVPRSISIDLSVYLVTCSAISSRSTVTSFAL